MWEKSLMRKREAERGGGAVQPFLGIITSSGPAFREMVWACPPLPAQVVCNKEL